MQRDIEAAPGKEPSHKHEITPDTKSKENTSRGQNRIKLDLGQSVPAMTYEPQPNFAPAPEIAQEHTAAGMSTLPAPGARQSGIDAQQRLSSFDTEAGV